MTKDSQVDLVGVGLNATDTMIFLPHHPVSGSKVEFHSSQVLPGGQVATAVVACQRWGLRTRYVGKLGDDPAADLHSRIFREAGVDARILTAANQPSQQAFILLDEKGERTVLWKRTASLALLPDELKKEWITNARALLIDGYDTAASIAASEWARAAGIPVIADIDEAYPAIEDLLSKVDYLIVSRDFPEKIVAQRELKKSLPELHARFGCRLTAATSGTGGVLAWDGSRFRHACAYRVNVVDTTGAGDIFHAGFIYALLQGWPLPKQLDFACAAAALNCTAIGARGGIRDVESIERLMQQGSRYAPADDYA